MASNLSVTVAAIWTLILPAQYKLIEQLEQEHSALCKGLTYPLTNHLPSVWGRYPHAEDSGKTGHYPVVGAGNLMLKKVGVFHTSTLRLQKRVPVFFLISSCAHQWVSKRIVPKPTCHNLCWYQWSLIWTSHGSSCQVLLLSCHGLTYSSLTLVETLFYC